MAETAAIPNVETDVLIAGGGIAGLWLLEALRAEGYRALLVERDALGQGQTVAAQGMVHGGVKYSLNGLLSRATEAIAEMPARWRSHLAGQRAPSLVGVPVVSEHYYLMTRSAATSRIAGLIGARVLRGRIQKLDRADYPSALHTSAFAGDVYEMTDPVLDTQSLLATLATTANHCLVGANIASIDGANGLVRLQHPGDPSRQVTVSARRVLLCAGVGNEALLHLAQHRSPVMQRRPLQQVLVQAADALPALYCHCVDSLQQEPALTITPHTTSVPTAARFGGPAWYLGGQLAGAGVHRSAAEQAQAAADQLAHFFPWRSWHGDAARYTTLSVDRAEPATQGRRPDDAFYQRINRLGTCWPTKMTLTPHLADQVLADLRTDVQPSQPFTTRPQPLADWPHPQVAPPPWAALTWHTVPARSAGQ